MGLGAYDVVASELEKLIPEATENEKLVSEAHRFLAEAHLGQGKATLALAAARQALTIAEATTNLAYDVGRTWRVLGQIAARLEQPIRVKEDDRRYDAAACFTKSVEIFTNTEVPRDRAQALWQWAEYELSQGNATTGKTMRQEARKTFERLNLPLMVARMDGVGQ